MAAGSAMLLGLALLPGLLATPVSADEPSASPATDAEPPPMARTTDRIIVGLTSSRISDTTVEWITEEVAADQSLILEPEVTSDITRTITVVSLGEQLPLDEVEDLAAGMAESSVVAYAEPDRWLQVAATLPDDPRAGELWGLWSGVDGGYGTRALDAWPTTRGSGVVVAVIDTGITAHPDLDAQIVPGYDFISDARVANDGDGRDDSAADPGDWITALESTSGFFEDCDVTDSSWHGTHVAGTIAAVAGNAQGVAGIAPDSRVQPIRALGKCGGYLSDVAASIIWASGAPITGVPDNSTPARVINLSLGGTASCDATMQQAVNIATARGSVVVAAAGNENANVSTSTPANCSGVIAVAAHNSSGNRASFSNYGSLVAVSGPGVNIVSTYNTGTTTPGSAVYDSLNGTSMATPHVAATAALLLSEEPALTPTQVRSAIQSTSRTFTGTSGCSTSLCGSGYIDAAAAVASLTATPPPSTEPPAPPAPPPPPPPPPAPVVPGTPTLLTATAGDRSIALEWVAPSSTGGAAIESYLVEVLSAEGVRSKSVASTSATVSALTNGVAYRARVAAVNSVGPGPWTDWSADITPRGPASAPRDVIAVASASSIDLSWAAPASDGGSPVSGYDVEIASSGQTQILAVDRESTTLLGLAEGATYSLRVAATTEVGRGAWSAPVSVTISAPRVSAPRNVRATWTAQTVTVRWKAPAIGTAVRYIVRASINGRGYITVSSTERTSTAFLVPSRARTVKVRVQAVDQQGPSSVSAPTRPRTRT